MTVTLDKMRADIAEMIGEEPEAVGLDDNLMDLGLDSMRLMNLILIWQEAGIDLEFGAFAERFTLRAWWEAVEQRRDAIAAGGR